MCVLTVWSVSYELPKNNLQMLKLESLRIWSNATASRKLLAVLENDTLVSEMSFRID